MSAREVLEDTVRALARIREIEGRCGHVSGAKTVHTTHDILSSMFAHTMKEIRGALTGEIARRGDPDQVITRRGAAYLERWWFERGEEGRAYLHRFVGPDPDVGPHDHPWDSASLIVAGAQDEYWMPADVNRTVRHRRLEAGDIVYRSARFAHQLRVARASRGAPLSIFVTGLLLREWGFWIERDGVLHHERHPKELHEEEST